MPEKKCYTVRQNRLKRAALTGMKAEADGTLVCVPEITGRSIFLGAFDGVEEGTAWGRLHFEGSFSENMAYLTHVIAMDEKEFLRKGVRTGLDEFLLSPDEQPVYKKMLFEQIGEAVSVNQKDMLLYDLKGRYLWVFIEILGEGEGYLKHIALETPGDNFMNTFPEIYRERGGFFHRYLSVFSSIYNDFQADIDQIAQKLDIDTAPAGLLPVFASWMGLEIDGDILEEKRLRALLKEAYQLCKYKGTRYALERVTELVLDEKPVIIEQWSVSHGGSRKEVLLYGKLYGSSPYDITMLIHAELPEEKQANLKFLLEQFKPVRGSLRLVFLREEGILDSYCYLDWNASIMVQREGILDQGHFMDRMITLK